MAKLETWYKQDLKRPLIVHKHTDVFNQDSKGNLIGVEVYSDGEPVVLAGSISGYCLLADGTTVPAVGASRSGNKASVLIPQTAYSVPGPITITIKNVEEDNITTLCATVGVVRQSVSGNLVNPGSVVTDWSNDINAQLQAVQTAADNVGAIVAAPFDENTVYVAGNYVTNNGNLYRITADHAAGVAWSGTAKVQCTVGHELEALNKHFIANWNLIDPDAASSTETDFIPVELNVRYNIIHAQSKGQFRYGLSLYDSNKTMLYISQLVDESTDGTNYSYSCKFTQSAIAYVKIEINSAPSGIDTTDFSKVYFGKGSEYIDFADYNVIHAIKKVKDDVSDLADEISDLNSALGTVPSGKTAQGQITDNASDISELKSAFDSVFTTTKSKNLFNKSTVLKNKYCNVSGVISDYNGRNVTDYIPVEAGKIVTSSYLNNASHVQTQETYSALCCYDSTKAVVSGGNINQQTFTVPDGVAFVRITFASSMYVYNGMVELTDDGVPTAYEPYVEDSVSLSEDITVQTGQVIGLESRLTTDESNILSIKNELDGILDTDIIFDQSGFIRYDGALIARSGYISTDYVDITVNGTFVKYKYRLRMFANTKIAYYNDSKVFISAISPSESSSLEYVEGEVPYVDGARYVRFCTASNATDYYVKYTTVKNAMIGGANDSNPCNYTGNDMSVFNKVLCIGDSLTSGTFNYRVGDTTGNYVEYAKYSYPTYLKKLTGCDTVNMGNGGMSSAEWYNAHKNDDLSGYNCAIIQLGVNDCIRYTTWGQTSVNAFTNIINKLKTDNKNIKIFVANIIPATSYSNSDYLAFSAALLGWVTSTYASDQNVIPLDMQQYGHTKDSPAYNCGHLSAYGYWRLAQDYKGYIGWYMSQNKTVFKEVQFIGTDYYYDPVN